VKIFGKGKRTALYRLWKSCLGPKQQYVASRHYCRH